MSGDRKDRPPLSGRPTSYEVGYGKPPIGSRFQPGRSGNPRGRPPGAKSRKPMEPALNAEQFQSIILSEAYRTVQVNDPSGPLTIPIAQAVMRSLAVNAAKGHQRSQKLFAELLANSERIRRDLHDGWFRTALAYKSEWEHELDRRKRLGINSPEPIPHPDDLVIDVATGTIKVEGPMTREEKARWELAAGLRDTGRAEIRKWEHALKRARSDEARANIEETIAIYRGSERGLSAAIGEWPARLSSGSGEK